ENQWPVVAKFLQHLEASADIYWQVPEFELASISEEDLDEEDAVDEELASEIEEEEAEDRSSGSTDSWQDDDPEQIYSAAYEDMVYRDSTDDGFDADIIDEFTDGTEIELEEEAQRLGQRLEFLSTIARLWRQTAIAWKMDAHDAQRHELLENWC